MAHGQKIIWSLITMMVLKLTVSAQTYGPETIVMATPMGTMKLKLFTETPLHRKNFIALIKLHYYDSLMFHRVIDGFMIQGGDSLSKRARPGDSLGHGECMPLIPAEFNAAIFHKHGRLAAARDGDDVNPQRASSGTQFYIVQGKVRTREDLDKYEARINKTNRARTERKILGTPYGQALKAKMERLDSENKTDSLAIIRSQIDEMIDREVIPYKFSKAQVEAYTTVGGTPHLDGSYTVFGEVIEGLDVIDKIAKAPRDSRDRPLKDIRMMVTIIE